MQVPSNKPPKPSLRGKVGRQIKDAKDKKVPYRKSVTLTKPEGEALDRIISDNGCENLSQLCKKIAQGILKLW